MTVSWLQPPSCTRVPLVWGATGSQWLGYGVGPLSRLNTTTDTGEEAGSGCPLKCDCTDEKPDPGYNSLSVQDPTERCAPT